LAWQTVRNVLSAAKELGSFSSPLKSAHCAHGGLFIVAEENYDLLQKGLDTSLVKEVSVEVVCVVAIWSCH
jgi:hypothetical protein